MVKFKFGCVVEHHKEDPRHKELDNLFLALHWEYLLLDLIVLNRVNYDLVFVCQYTDPFVIQKQLFYIVLIVDLIHKLASLEQSFLSDPSVELDIVTRPRS